MKKITAATINKEIVDKTVAVAYMLQAWADDLAETDSDTADVLAVCAGWIEKALDPASTVDGIWANMQNGLF